MAIYGFDGTWNRRDGADVVDHLSSPGRSVNRDTIETNVRRICEFYPDGRAVYLEGVGTRFGGVGRVFGGAFGLGGRHRIRKMYRELCKRFADGDQTIELVGFSRGAALAIHFANLLYKRGITHPGNRRHLLWSYSRDLGWSFRQPKRDPKTDIQAPAIQFLGLFDTVATFGFPLGPVRNASATWKVWTIPPNVDRAFHAVALDEIRRTFELVTPVMSVTETGEKRTSRYYEVWFRGAHANVGGGYIDRGLSDITLAWMLEQMLWAVRKRGEPDHDDHTAVREALGQIAPGGDADVSWEGTTREALRPDPHGAIGRTRKVPRKPSWRNPRTRPAIHHSVAARRENLVADHYNLNRPLLRTVPGDRVWALDPPAFHDRTTEKIAIRVATQLATRVPARPSEWLRLDDSDDGYLFRGGPNGKEWIAQGTVDGRSGPAVRLLQIQDFVRIAAKVLTSGPDSADVAALLRDDDTLMVSSDDLKAAVEWVRDVIIATWPYVPRDSESEIALSWFPGTRLTSRHSPTNPRNPQVL